MKIIIGLGNPGKQYEKTRHNAGFMAIDRLAEKLGLTWESSKRFNARIAKAPGLVLAKPQTFMNNSGQSANKILTYYDLSPKKLGIFKASGADISEVLTLIHDDLDIELGKFKISVDSRSAGHNGVQSVMDHLKTKKIRRVRLGIKTEALSLMPAEKFVLQKFSEDEMKMIEKMIEEIIPLIAIK
jgi:PTH1 family peptidyl-tRNA hydrolase